MAIVYRHIRLDKNQPFYIGIGKNLKRAYKQYGRNKYWKSIVDNTPYDVEIIFDDLTWKQAQEKEKEFIALYGRIQKGGILSNMTDGGEGEVGKIFTNKSKLKMSNAKKNNIASIENIKRLAEKRKGTKQNEEWIEKGKISRIGSKRSEETKKKMSDASLKRDKEVWDRIAKKHRGMKRSEDAKQKMSDAKRKTYLYGMLLSNYPFKKVIVRECGTKNGLCKPGTNTGKKFSQETREKMRLATKNSWVKRKMQLHGQA